MVSVGATSPKSMVARRTVSCAMADAARLGTAEPRYEARSERHRANEESTARGCAMLSDAELALPKSNVTVAARPSTAGAANINGRAKDDERKKPQPA